MHVFLIRHGETSLNAAGVLRGQLDVPLDETGEAEALALGELFRGVPLSAVVSSPLTRALDTARQVCSASGAPFTIDERLRDRYYGEWAGRSLEEVEERFGSIDAAPSVEARQVFEDRAEEALADAVAAADAVTAVQAAAGEAGVALVTHDAVLCALLGRRFPDLDIAELKLPTGSWSELVVSPGGEQWGVVHLGEIPASGQRPCSGSAEP